MRRSMHSDSFSKKRRAKIVIAHLRVMERFLRRKKANHQVTCLTPTAPVHIGNRLRNSSAAG
jgi:hypothetical protein